jgi:hypothetical protein
VIAPLVVATRDITLKGRPAVAAIFVGALVIVGLIVLFLKMNRGSSDD